VYTSHNIVLVIRFGMGETRRKHIGNKYTVFTRKQRKKLIGRPKRKWEDDVKMEMTVFWDVSPCRLLEID
jgi:hypothetical protein